MNVPFKVLPVTLAFHIDQDTEADFIEEKIT